MHVHACFAVHVFARSLRGDAHYTRMQYVLRDGRNMSRDWQGKRKENKLKRSEHHTVQSLDITVHLHRHATNTMLKEARQQQVHHKEHFLAMQAMQDRREFERVLK